MWLRRASESPGARRPVARWRPTIAPCRFFQSVVPIVQQFLSRTRDRGGSRGGGGPSGPEATGVVRLDPVWYGPVRVHAGLEARGEWDRACRAMAHANAEWLSWLHRRYTACPIDWAVMLSEFTLPSAP